MNRNNWTHGHTGPEWALSGSSLSAGGSANHHGLTFEPSGRGTEVWTGQGSIMGQRVCCKVVKETKTIIVNSLFIFDLSACHYLTGVARASQISFILMLSWKGFCMAKDGGGNCFFDMFCRSILAIYYLIIKTNIFINFLLKIVLNHCCP